ncbi:MAG: hypothetical protein HC924_18930 [Synechococcaceae cyanobacterium SM2_3_2]|nr:hypothetical protein [Synechococcaceae cyanobacterium SM2_3_2]
MKKFFPLLLFLIASSAYADSLLTPFDYSESPIKQIDLHSGDLIFCDGTARPLPLPNDPTIWWTNVLVNWDFEGNITVKQGVSFHTGNYEKLGDTIYVAELEELVVVIAFTPTFGDADGILSILNTKTNEQESFIVTIQEGC